MRRAAPRAGRRLQAGGRLAATGGCPGRESGTWPQANPAAPGAAAGAGCSGEGRRLLAAGRTTDPHARQMLICHLRPLRPIAAKSCTVTADCSNCGRLQFISIPRGDPTKNFNIKAAPCPTCGVDSLEVYLV